MTKQSTTMIKIWMIEETTGLVDIAVEDKLNERVLVLLTIPGEKMLLC